MEFLVVALISISLGVCLESSNVTAKTSSANDLTIKGQDDLKNVTLDGGKNISVIPPGAPRSPKTGRAMTIWGLHTKCPMAFEEAGGRCYFFGHFPLNWYRAMEFCHSFGSGVSLAAIETSREDFFIKQFLKASGGRNTGIWVGGSDNGHNGQWTWYPTGQVLQYSGWGPSQPSGGDQHCMYLVGSHLSYQWADFHCLFDMNFLCEYNVNEITPW